jgi:hypothetical protein
MKRERERERKKRKIGFTVIGRGDLERTEEGLINSNTNRKKKVRKEFSRDLSSK